MRKPIGPTLHGALDYGFLASMLAVPKLLRLPRRARVVAAAFGAAQGGLNAVTDHPLAVRHLVPFRLHGSVDRAGLPVVIGLPLLTGLLRDRRALAFFLGSGIALGAVYALTDWDAQDGAADTSPGPTTSGQQGPESRGSAGPDANGVTDARSAADAATPAEGPADAAGPTVGSTDSSGADGPRRPATVDTAPSIRGTSSTTAHASDTGAADAGTTDDREDLAANPADASGRPAG